MKRILIFHPTIAPYRVDFFNAFNSAYEMRLCLRYENLKDQHFDDYQRIMDSCSFQPVYLPSLCMGKRVVSHGVLAQIKEYVPDIVIGIEYSFEVCVALAYSKVSRWRYQVMTISDDSINMVAENNDFSRVHKWMRNLIAPKMSQIILASKDVCQWYQAKFGKGVYFPIIRDEKNSVKGYSESLPLSNKYVQEYHLEGKSVYLSVGRLVELKRVEDTIKAFKRMSSPDAVLVIVGDGDHRDYLESAAGADRNILFTGRLEGVALLAWYNIATTFVLSSRLEPFGAVTNEALLGGCKAIVSRQCGSACLIEEGVNGYVFESGDIDSLTECMSNTLSDVVPSSIVLRKSKMTEDFASLFKKLCMELDQIN